MTLRCQRLTNHIGHKEHSSQKVLATLSIVLGETHIVASTNMSDLATFQELAACLKGKVTFGGFHFEGNTLN